MPTEEQIKEWNRNARFFPCTDDAETPAIEVAGVMVSAYVDTTHFSDPDDTTPYLQVSIDYDDAGDSTLLVNGIVPTVIHAGYGVVWNSRTQPRDRTDEVGFRRSVPPTIDRHRVLEVTHFCPGNDDLYATAVATTERDGKFSVHTVIYRDNKGLDDLGDWVLDTSHYDLTRERARAVAHARGLVRLSEADER